MGDLIPILIVVSVPVLWLGSSFAFSRIGGWAALARESPDNQPATDEAFTRCSGSVGIARYRGCLNLRASDAGLHLAMLFPFRLFHPPLFIPWSAFHDTTTRRLLHLSITSTSVGSPAIAHLKLPEWVAEHISSAE